MPARRSKGTHTIGGRRRRLRLPLDQGEGVRLVAGLDPSVAKRDENVAVGNGGTVVERENTSGTAVSTLSAEELTVKEYQEGE